nr:chorismate synthase [Haladaptatus sp. R4]
MNGNRFGRLFQVTTYGESHGEAMGVTISGCPAGLELSTEDVQADLDRRKPGQSMITTSRNEPDAVTINSGVQDGYTTGTPIGMVIQNKDAQSGKYEPFITAPRPSHGDFTYSAKFGTRNWGGGGRFVRARDGELGRGRSGRQENPLVGRRRTESPRQPDRRRSGPT